MQVLAGASRVTVKGLAVQRWPLEITCDLFRKQASRRWKRARAAAPGSARAEAGRQGGTGHRLRLAFLNKPPPIFKTMAVPRNTRDIFLPQMNIMLKVIVMVHRDHFKKIFCFVHPHLRVLFPLPFRARGRERGGETST